MTVENGEWVLHGRALSDPDCIRTWQALVSRIDEVGFLPLFGNEIAGFSVEEHVPTEYWWTGDPARDPWEWRAVIARSRQVAYGKFFGQKAGFISLKWLPRFANARRDGYDFDAAWEDGRLTRRERLIMDCLTETDEDGGIVWRDSAILSTDLKRLAGFGKGGEKNFPGTVTDLMMRLYLVTADFQRRRSKKGAEFGMAVSVLLPPEALWGYDAVTAAYPEEPAASWEKLRAQLLTHFPHADEPAVRRLLGNAPGT